MALKPRRFAEAPAEREGLGTRAGPAVLMNTINWVGDSTVQESN